MIHLVHPSRPLLARLQETLRQADRRELVATVGNDNVEHIHECCSASREVSVAVDAAREPVAIFGVAPYAGQAEVGIPWLLGTDLMHKYPRTLHREAQRIVARWHGWFPILTNATDKRNTVVLHWLQRLGFHLVRELPLYGVARIPFIQFTRRHHV